MPDYGLSSQQLAVICALSSGANMTTAAEQAGVHRNTIANWRRNSLPFEQGLAQAQYDRALYYREKLEDLFDLAIQALRDILADSRTSPSIRLKAIVTITGIATTPPEPKKQVELDIEKIVVKRTDPEIVPFEAFNFPPEVPNKAQPVPAETPSPMPTDAQPTPSVSQESAPPPSSKPRNTPRNAKCPCNSGKKYKRCCLDASPPLATAA